MKALKIRKAALLEALRERIAQELQTLQDSQKSAQQGAVHAETRQEDPKDTRAIEAQYIARGFADRVEGLRDTLAALNRFRLDALGPDDPVVLSALVGVNDGEREKLYFIVPVAGGETLEVDGVTVQTLTPQSPLGQALMDQYVDETIELRLPGGVRTATIDSIR